MRGLSIVLSTFIITLSAFCFYFQTNLLAQNLSHEWGIEVSSGFTYGYFNEASRLTPVYGLSINYAVSPGYTIKLKGFTGHFKTANRSNYYGRWFDNNYSLFTIRQQVNLFELFGLHSIAHYVDLNGFAGAGFLKNQVQTGINTSIAGYERWQGVNYKGNSIAYSFGGGITFNITHNISFIMQYEHNLTNSDYIDGFKTVIPNNGQSQPIRVRYDAFSFTTAGISVHFGGRKKHHPAKEKEPMTDFQKENMQQLEKLGTLVTDNAQNLKETNDQIRQTLRILTEFVSSTSRLQLNDQEETSKIIQVQIDSLRKKLIRTDSLIASKQRTDSLIQRQQEAAIKALKENQTNPGIQYKYYIVADSYLTYGKATDALTKLKSDGYSNATIVNDKTNTYYLVAYTVVNDEKTANLLLKKIKSYQNPMAWLYKTKTK